MTDAVPAGLTVLEAIEWLRADGYDGDFSVHGDGLRCGRCGQNHGVDGIDVEAILRVEGASDPADEAIVLGLRCADCESQGVLVAGYGPTADPVESAVVTQLGRAERALGARPVARGDLAYRDELTVCRRWPFE